MSDNEKLLTAEEQDACQKIAASDAGLASQRATALLALGQGATRAQASEQAGLTVGQIRYLLRTFRQKRLAMFPDIEPDEAQRPAEVTEPEEEASGPEEDKEEKAEKAKKAKKPKGKKPKGKKDKKAKKKAKKPKKGKAAKKKKAKKRKA